jgi:dipeptidyl aminopeptidase/acylaminoacyl peptidase
MRSSITFIAAAALVFTPTLASSQEDTQGTRNAQAAQVTDVTVTAADYARAESMLRANTTPLVFGTSVRPNWMEGDRFWYANRIPGGTEFVLVDPARRSRARAFDHAALATTLAMETGETYAALDLPFNEIEMSDDLRSFSFDLDTERFTCEVTGVTCQMEPRMMRGDEDDAPDRSRVTSPDQKRAAFIRDDNLWMVEFSTGAETQLTTDGIEDFGYATNNAGWIKSDRPVLVWSPDSKRIATFQHDGRGVGDMYLVSTEVGHPTLEAWKYPMPEDSVIFRISRVVIDVEAPSVTRLDMAPDQHRSTICDHVYCGGTWADIDWSEDGSQLAFVSTSRDHKEAHLRVANPRTGAVRDVMSETVETFFESGYNQVNWSLLEESNEVIWYSRRSDWGHLYMYDLNSGAMKHDITSGDWNVLQVRYVDRDDRKIYFTGGGREPGDPYFDYFYSVNMDGSDLRLLTPESANHVVQMSPDKRYILDTYSTPVIPQVTVVRDLNGMVLATLEEADISRLEATTWQPPIPFITKARDGETDLYGLMYKPSNFDPSKKYPVINYLYPGPQSGSVGSRSFSPARRDNQAIAELGFVVIEVDAMGTPKRSQSFQAAYYGNMGDNGLPDQITTIKQLAERYDWIDIDRVGIWGHSGGGFASTAGILRYPDFYDVAVSEAGNHDNRNYEDDWGEKWQGLLRDNADGSTSYDNQANQLLAENLKGKLLLAHGSMDNNVPPANTMVMVNALIAANKDFDLIMFPNRRHGFAMENYMIRRRWDYFVKNLLGVDPPAYEIGRKPIS